MIVVKLVSGATPDLATLRKTLAAQVPSAILDDHRALDRPHAHHGGHRSRGGIAILALVIAVTVLSVTFATRGAMATNRAVVEVLHYVGATDSFIAHQFQRHFLLLGLKGGAIGGGAAIGLFGVMRRHERVVFRYAGRRRGRGPVRHLFRRLFGLSWPSWL